MRIDFYQLSRDPVEQVVPLLARKAVESGVRVAIACEDDALRKALSDALWGTEAPAFLANGEAGAGHEERQPILLSADGNTANGATMAIYADGRWRTDKENLKRAMWLFSADQTEAARDLWRELGEQDGNDLQIFKQLPGGGWRKGR